MPGRWITLEPSGTHVHLDSGGDIDKGPAAVKGTKPSKLKDRKPVKSPQVKPSPLKKPDETKTARPQLTQDEVYALEHYTASAWINDELRGLPLRPETKYFSKERMDEVRRELTSAFKKVKTAPEHTQVYRGAGFDNAEERDSFISKMTEAVHDGSEVVMPGYTSTSNEASGATDYMGEHGVFVKIEANKYLDMNHYSAGGRGEMLLDHNSRFKVKTVEKDENGKPVIVLVQVA